MKPVAFPLLAKGRARHIPPQTDTTLGLLRNMSCSSSIALFRPKRNATSVLHVMAFLRNVGYSIFNLLKYVSEKPNVKISIAST